MACPEAAVGWGVALIDGRVGWSVHPSVKWAEDAPTALLDPEPTGEAEEYWPWLEVIPTGYQGYPRSGYAVFIKRSLAVTADSASRVDPDILAPPSADEADAVNRYLDELGFTGDRKVRLILVAREV